MTTIIKELINELRAIRREIMAIKYSKKEIYTLKEAAIVIGVSHSYMQKLVAGNQISYSKPNGKLIFIQKIDLYNFISQNHISSKDEIDTFVADLLVQKKMS
ncbi:DNA-binding protein [Zobellia russellii]|uniref:DNA-binding protein n=1 Tax=Zobellia russellii TaxID=248907 RepID=UPI0037DD28B4